MRMMSDSSKTGDLIIDLNVGGVFYTTTLSTLTSVPKCRLARMFSAKSTDCKSDPKLLHNGKYFVDRDGLLFRYILDYLRNHPKPLLLPDSFQERDRLRQEAEFYELPDMIRPAVVAPQRSPMRHSTLSVNGISATISRSLSGLESASITVGYRGTFAFGRGDGAGTSDVKFRKVLRILVAGRVSVCREVFRDTLNESRDPDRGEVDRYTARFFLKHLYLEQAFDMLHEGGFRLAGATASGTNSAAGSDAKSAGVDSEETRWLHYNEYVFTRP